MSAGGGGAGTPERRLARARLMKRRMSQSPNRTMAIRKNWPIDSFFPGHGGWRREGCCLGFNPKLLPVSGTNAPAGQACALLAPQGKRRGGGMLPPPKGVARDGEFRVCAQKTRRVLQDWSG